MTKPDLINELTRKIAQVCAGCPHMHFESGMACDRKKSQCHSGRVRKWLAEIEKLQRSKTPKRGGQSHGKE